VSDPVVTSERRRPSLLLIVSLCLNVALVAGAAMMFMRGFGFGFGPPPREPKGVLSPVALMRMVPEESDKIQKIMDAHHARMHALRQVSMQARVGLMDALTAQNFDKAALDKAMLALEAADDALQAENLKATSESVAILTQAERESVADQLKKPRFWRRMGHRHGP
jgi:Spy/CpxP family protein refolding chaperone